MNSKTCSAVLGKQQAYHDYAPYLFSLLRNYGRALLLLWGHLWDVPWPLAGLVPAHQLTAGWAVRSPMGFPMTSGLTGAVPTAGWWDGSSDVPMGCSMTSAWSGVGPPADCWEGLSVMPHVWCPMTYGWTGASPLVGCWVGPSAVRSPVGCPMTSCWTAGPTAGRALLLWSQL